jgi:hypothetical protein
MEKNMKENFEKLERRVFDSLNDTDLQRINYELSKIDGPTLVSGVGGSSVVSDYASKILSQKNRIITRNTEPRDFRYLDTDVYKNVLACSYSGNNLGVDVAFDNDLNHYLLASKQSEKPDVINLNYNCIDKEKSFVSLAATLIPCSILLNYYIDNRWYRIIDDLDSYDFDFDPNCDVFEIFSGYDTSTASKYLESTMVESGIGVPVVHDKYSYIHGRSTLSTVGNNIAIFFDTGSQWDKALLEELHKYYKEVIVLNRRCTGTHVLGYKTDLFSEYNLLLECMYLTKYIAEKKQKDLSGVDYNPIVKKLYKYHGEL